VAADLGLTPWAFLRHTPGEVADRVQAAQRRAARHADERAWTVAHLMVATGNLQRGTTVASLMRDLLGRAPGTVPGQPEADAEPAGLSPEASVEYMAMVVRGLGGKDLRPGKGDG
jgi:hypothetical protein